MIWQLKHIVLKGPCAISALRLCLLQVQSGLNPTNPEFRYLNSGSVRANLDLATKTHGFGRLVCKIYIKTMLPAGHVQITPTEPEIRYQNLGSVRLNF